MRIMRANCNQHIWLRVWYASYSLGTHSVRIWYASATKLLRICYAIGSHLLRICNTTYLKCSVNRYHLLSKCLLCSVTSIPCWIAPFGSGGPHGTLPWPRHCHGVATEPREHVSFRLTDGPGRCILVQSWKNNLCFGVRYLNRPVFNPGWWAATMKSKSRRICQILAPPRASRAQQCGPARDPSGNGCFIRVFFHGCNFYFLACCLKLLESRRRLLALSSW